MTEKLQVVMGRKTPRLAQPQLAEKGKNPLSRASFSPLLGVTAPVWGEGESSHASERDIYSACPPISTVSATLRA